LLIVVAAAFYLTFRIYGVRAGWWPTLLPLSGVKAVMHSASSDVHTAFARILAKVGA
jgi:hypothetical protein